MSELRLREILENIGLTTSEAKIFLVLIKSGASLAGEITKKSSLHRRTVYDVLRRLIEKGFVSHIVKNNRYYFEAVKPEHLRNYIKEKENLIEEAMPGLNTLYNTLRKKESVKFFTGRHGLKTVFEDQLHEKQEILILGASPDAHQIFRYYFKWFDKRRKRLKIPVKAVFSSSFKNLGKIPLAEIRFLPERYLGLAAINIYGNKISIILWSEKPFAILIDDKNIADSYRKFFDLVWKQGKEL